MDWVATYKMMPLLNIGNLKWGGSKNVAGFGHVKFEVPLQWPRGNVLLSSLPPFQNSIPSASGASLDQSCRARSGIPFSKTSLKF